jgi:hypothetical protein
MLSTSANITAELSSLQFQVASLSAQGVAMSSSIQAINQDATTNTVISEVGLIVGILAFIAAIAVARRADALFRESRQSQAVDSPPPKK